MKKVILIIRDGWGESSKKEGNAPLLARTPNHDIYNSKYPQTLLDCFGNAVGNPENTQGGSEVGHLTLGAGRIVWQPYELINQSIKNGSFFSNEALLNAIENCKKNNSNLHLSGLFSDQGIHADLRHMFAILDLCKKQDFDRVYIHLCLDGRDVPEKSASIYIEMLESKIKEIGLGKISTLFGRYYGMDRDTNWDRTLKAYNVMVTGEGFKSSSPLKAIEEAYGRGDKTDYYVQPILIEPSFVPVKDNDSFIWFNFRTDRSRQITAMFNDLDCPVEHKKVKLHYVCFSSYDDSWTLPVAFNQTKVENNLGLILSKQGKKQLRISETEKYAHVTFFFNSQDDAPYDGEDRILIPSPKVPSYDMKPEMSAYELTDKLLEKIEKEKYEFILVNYANPDLVGHSANVEATIKACEVVDECVGKVVSLALEKDYVILLTSDHGNAEYMVDEEGNSVASHGMNKVKLYLISNDEKLINVKLKEKMGLKDISPTILKLMEINKPKEMNGEPLF